MARSKGSLKARPTLEMPPRRRRRASGNILVEGMLVISLLFSLTFGMIEFGYCYYCKNMLMNAAREGARVAIVPGSSTSDVSAAVTAALSCSKWPGTYYTVAITDTSNNAINLATVSAGSQVQVAVSGSWGNIGRGMSPLQLISTSKQISGVCAMRKEQ